MAYEQLKQIDAQKISLQYSQKSKNLYDNIKNTPLHDACRNGNIEMVKILIAKEDTDIDVMDNVSNNNVH